MEADPDEGFVLRLGTEPPGDLGILRPRDALTTPVEGAVDEHRSIVPDSVSWDAGMVRLSTL